MLWLLFEAVLAALKQTVGLAKTHLRQEGRLWSSGWRLLLATVPALPRSRPQPTEKPQASPREAPDAGGALSILSEL